MPVKSRRSYKGAAVQNTLGSQLLVGGTSISLSTAMSGWPTSAEPFFCVIEPGTAREEKVCVIYATTTTLTVVDPADATSPWGASANGRGVDNTTAYQHEAGSVIYPCITARDLDEANELVATYKSQGALVHQGASTFTELTIGTAGQVLKVNSGATAPEWGQAGTAGIADSAVTLAKLAAAVQEALNPAGVINPYAGSSAPSGWLLCDGSEISRTTYAALFAVVGTAYGAGDGTTTFNLPDLKGRIPVGRDSGQTEFDTLGETGGAKTHTLSTAEIPAHQHNISAYSHTVNQSNALGNHSHGAGSYTSSGSITGGDHSHTGTVDSGGFHEHSILTRNTTSTSHTHQSGSRLAVGSDGTDTTRATDYGGTHTHTFTTASASHSHTFTGGAVSGTSGETNLSHGHSVSVDTHAAKLTDTNTGGGGAHNNLQPYVVVNYIIKH